MLAFGVSCLDDLLLVLDHVCFSSSSSLRSFAHLELSPSSFGLARAEELLPVLDHVQMNLLLFSRSLA